MTTQIPNAESTDPAYKTLYQVDGVAAFIVAGLIILSVMLRSDSFSKLTDKMGILTFALSLADYIRQALTSSVLITLLVVLPIVLFLEIWFILVGWRLYQLGRLKAKMLPEQP